MKEKHHDGRGPKDDGCPRGGRQLMRSEHVDVLRESVALMVRELMEAEVATQIGAELGERAPDARSAAQRISGTRVGHARR